MTVAMENASAKSRIAEALKRHRDGDLAAAAALYAQGVVDDPADGDCWQGIGVLSLQNNDPATARALLERATRVARHDHARIYYHLALARLKLDDLDGATAALIDSINADRGYEGSYKTLAEIQRSRGRLFEAAEIWLALGRRRFGQGIAETAMAAYEQALEVVPGHKGALFALAPLLRFFGRRQEAADAYGRILAQAPGDLAARLGFAMSQLHIIHRDTETMAADRIAYARELAMAGAIAGSASNAALAAAEHAIGDCKPFYLNYHGLNDRDLQCVYGDVVVKTMSAHLPQFAQQLRPAGDIDRRKARVGFISPFLHEHSVSKLFVGWPEEIDHNRFEVFGYHLGRPRDAYTERFAAASTALRYGVGDTAAWAQAIREDALDALIYLDVGMSGMEVRLAALRLAPVQAFAWGHPVTTGMPTMDYALSSALMEPYNGQNHYREKLAALPNLSICYDRVHYDKEPSTRADYDLQAQDAVFICCQSLFKYLPEHDDVFPAIAKRLPAARFVFIKHHLPEVTAVFADRLERAFAARGLIAADHCRFAERVPRDRFGGFLGCGDVYLDSIGWSGGNTTLEAVAAGLPTVTLAADLMRGRHTTGILRRLDLEAFIAHDIEGYVDMAARLGGDAALRRRAQERMAQNAPLLYRDAAPVRALERLLVKAIRARA